MTEIIGAFVLGFFGSAHCVGMCGAFVMGIGGIARRSGNRAGTLAAYFAGKTLTYVFLGVIAGAVGSIAGSLLADFQAALSIMIGVLLVLVGVALFGFTRWNLPGGRLYAALSSRTARLMQRRGMLNMTGLGLLNGLLPCGLVYAALVLAAASGSVVSGGLAMGAFGLATVPALAVVGWSVGWLDRTGLRRYLPQVGAVLVIVMGVLAIARATPVMQLLHGHQGHVETHEVEAEPNGHAH